MVAPEARQARQPGVMDRLALYRGLGWLVRPVLPMLARKAHRRQGAAPARLPERWGHPSADRPAGGLVWIHAASVGEVNSVLGFARAIAARTGLAVLFTTATEGGRQALLRQEPAALHQFAPVDLPAAVGRFLGHWRPDLAIFVEADLWPGMVGALGARGVPMALLNARPSASRRRHPGFYGALLSRCALITTQTAAVRDEIRALGLPADRVRFFGNLKAAIRPPAEPGDLARRFAAAVGARPVWAAVSTHPGEDEVLLGAHARLGGDALLLLAPRHPDRTAAILALAQGLGLETGLRSRDGVPGPAVQVFVVDTLGETGAVQAVAPVAFVGGSLVPGIGGHTPFEPAAQGCALLSGPHVAHFAEAFAALRACGAAAEVADAPALEAALRGLLADPGARAAAAEAGRAFVRAQSAGLDATVEAVAALLPAPVAAASGAG